MPVFVSDPNLQEENQCIQREILNVVRFWVEKYPVDFLESEAAKQKLKRLVELSSIVTSLQDLGEEDRSAALMLRKSVETHCKKGTYLSPFGNETLIRNPP